MDIREHSDVFRPDNQISSTGTTSVNPGIECARDTDTPPRFSVIDALESALAKLEPKLRTNTKVIREFEEVPHLMGSEADMTQAFFNLLHNALDAIEEGMSAEDRLTIKVRRHDELVAVEITDTGCGIIPAVTDQIFTPFFSTKSPERGVGIGLSVCQQILDGHDAQLDFETTVGEGTCFTVHIPCQIEDDAQSETSDDEQCTSAARRIAVIDDEPHLLASFDRILGRSHRLRRFQNAREFLDALAMGESFDLIFCDLNMPNFSGIDVYDSLVENHPEMVDRTVFVTGGITTLSAFHFVERVGPPLLEKPFGMAAIRDVVANHAA